MNETRGSRIGEDIAAANRQFMETFERQDAQGMAELYTDDGAVYPPGADMMQGHAAIQAF